MQSNLKAVSIWPVLGERNLADLSIHVYIIAALIKIILLTDGVYLNTDVVTSSA